MFPYRRVPAHITGLYIFTVINFLVLCHAAIVQGKVLVKKQSNETVREYDDVQAVFGIAVPFEGVQGYLRYANPSNGCSPLAFPPNSSRDPWIVLIRRNDCPFDVKVRNAQNAGYIAAIVHDTKSNILIPMGPSDVDDIDIPSVFVGVDAGTQLKARYTYDKGYYICIYEDRRDTNMMDYIIAFACIMGFIFLTAVTSLIVRYVRDLRQRRRHRLSPQNLKKLPVKKFGKGEMQYDTCAICLEDYTEGDKMRILPCSHAYHTKCIDPWLTKSRRTCPVCKRKVFSAGEVSDSDEDSDDDESTPLLNAHNQPTTSGNTFSSLPTPLANRNQARDAFLDEDVLATSGNVNASLLHPAPIGMSINLEEDDVICVPSTEDRTSDANDTIVPRDGNSIPVITVRDDSPIQIGMDAATAIHNDLTNNVATSNPDKEHVLVV